MPAADDLLTFSPVEPDVEIRNESKREIAIRFMKWGEIGRTEEGLETFEPGAFDDNRPEDIILRMEHEGPPAGIGIALERDDIGQTIVGRAANTPRGDEMLQLAKEGIYKGASPMFRRDNHQTKYERMQDGQRLARRIKVDTREVSLTWRPTYQGTGPLFVRSQEEIAVAEDTVQPVEDAKPAVVGVPADLDLLERVRQFAHPMEERLQALEARSESEKRIITAIETLADHKPTGAEVPNPSKPVPYRGDWMKAALTLMDGGDLPPHEMRALADNISSDNPGFVPTVYSNELIGIIDPLRPFLGSTRRIDMPANGLSISYPRITQRPLVAEQTTEKTEVASRKVTTDRVSVDVQTFAGAGDLSIQLLRRSEPSFLNAFIDLLGEAYATVTEDAAVDALLAAGITNGTGTFDPADPEFGEAFENGASIARQLTPDTMWLSTTAVVEFMNAKSPSGGGGTPLYPGMAGISGITGGGDSGPSPMRLNPVWTPALDNETTDVLIGPSRGFAWGEEGTFTLAADVPGRLGRDVALAGFIVFVPLYPAAFTRYVVAT